MEAGAQGGVAAPEGVAGGVPFFAPAVHHEGVARFHRHALRVADFLQFPAVHRRFLRDIVNAAMAGHVQQDAAGDDAFLPVVDGAVFGAVELDHFVRVFAVPHPVGVPHMAQGIEVGGGGAVIRDAVVVGGHSAARLAGAFPHIVDGRGGVVGRRRHGKLPAQRDGLAGFDQAGGAAAFGVVDHIDGAFLVVRPPAAPVHIVLEVGEDFVPGGRFPARQWGVVRSGHRHFPPAPVAREGRLPRRAGVGKSGSERRLVVAQRNRPGAAIIEQREITEKRPPNDGPVQLAAGGQMNADNCPLMVRVNSGMWIWAR